MRRFTSIDKLSTERRLPRLGKIKLGRRVFTKKNAKCKHEAGVLCNYCSRPEDLDYFIVPPEVARVYGDKPKELDVILPVEDEGAVFPQSYESYGAGTGLFCNGDGVLALRRNPDNPKDMIQVECPCDRLDKKLCSRRAHLMFMLPLVSVGGLYQIDTTSWNSIVDINSYFAYLRSMVGRIARVPLKLKRVATQITHDGKARTHHTMRLDLVADYNQLESIRNDASFRSLPSFKIAAPLLEAPVDEEGGPALYDEEHIQEGTVERADGAPPADEPGAAQPAPPSEAYTRWCLQIAEVLQLTGTDAMIQRFQQINSDIAQNKQFCTEDELKDLRVRVDKLASSIKERRK